MALFGEVKESIEMEYLGGSEKKEILQEAMDRFDKIMGDDKVPEMPAKTEERDEKFTRITSDEKFDHLFMDNMKSSDFLTEQENTDSCQFEEHDNIEQKEPNSKPEGSDNIHETDDEGTMYKKNGELLPNAEYIINGNKYRTDENGHQISCDSIPRYTEEGSRNTKEQKESGGEERREDDDGGHIIAKILGGAEGAENLVPMRRTINRGDYKKMENEISKALQSGKQVDFHINLTYNENSQRPSKILGEYMIDGRSIVVEFDNNECSIELLDSLGEKISDVDYYKLKEEIEDMAAEDIPSSITSVKMEHDVNGNPIKVTVGLLDELSGIKTYKSYEPRGHENED